MTSFNPSLTVSENSRIFTSQNHPEASNNPISTMAIIALANIPLYYACDQLSKKISKKIETLPASENQDPLPKAKSSKQLLIRESLIGTGVLTSNVFFSIILKIPLNAKNIGLTLLLSGFVVGAGYYSKKYIKSRFSTKQEPLNKATTPEQEEKKTPSKTPSKTSSKATPRRKLDLDQTLIEIEKAPKQTQGQKELHVEEKKSPEPLLEEKLWQDLNTKRKKKSRINK